MKHVPVLLGEVMEFLDPRPGSFVIDGTLDGGGHAREIISRIGPRGRFLGVDLDRTMVDRFAAHHANVRTLAVHGNYADLKKIIAERKLPKADGLLLDLGFSSEQLASSGRGFSFLSDEPLIMTYDADREPVAVLLKTLSEIDMARIIRTFGNERYAARIAKAIKIRGRAEPIRTSKTLADVIRAAVPKGYERGRIDPATRTFQALRMYANDELGNLEHVLHDIPFMMKPGGRAVVLSFHSLEDRIVKHAFRDGAKNGQYELLTKKPITASRNEVLENPRSRSAKLRAIRLATS